MGISARPTIATRLTAVKVDTATPADLPAVAAIERDVFSDPWSPRSFQELLGNPAVYFVCARQADDHSVLGYVVAWFVADEGQIANLAVDRVVCGHGIGKQLLDAALAEGRSRGAECVYLEVRDSNQRARGLYRSRGFEEVGRRRGYYRRPAEDAIVLRRTLR
jgi:ribosomal-protein-alanine N-acetyltransferase